MIKQNIRIYKDGKLVEIRPAKDRTPHTVRYHKSITHWSGQTNGTIEQRSESSR